MKRTKTIAQLKNIFREKDISECVEIPKDEQRGYMDASNCLMIIPKTNIGQELLINFEIGEPQKAPDLNYQDNVQSGQTSSYSIEYIKTILEFIQSFSYGEECVKLTTAGDFPLKVELKHFIIILAPRVNND